MREDEGLAIDEQGDFTSPCVLSSRESDHSGLVGHWQGGLFGKNAKRELSLALQAARQGSAVKQPVAEIRKALLAEEMGAPSSFVGKTHAVDAGLLRSWRFLNAANADAGFDPFA